jgi:hypothetical protein
VWAGPIDTNGAVQLQLQQKTNENDIPADQGYLFHPAVTYSKTRQNDLEDGHIRNSTNPSRAHGIMDYHEAGKAVLMERCISMGSNNSSNDLHYFIINLLEIMGGL